MATTFDGHKRSVEIVTAGYHFLLDVLPIREPQSREALERFVAACEGAQTSIVELDLVLMRCLEVLSGHGEQWIPGLLDEYVQAAADVPNPITRFSQCVSRQLRFRGIDDALVRDVVSVIGGHFANPDCSPRFVAQKLDHPLRKLELRFHNHSGLTVREHIREVRLEHACDLLKTPNKSIKEIWVAVGYLHHSNFDHDFKRRFGCTPSAYRARPSRSTQALYRPRINALSEPLELTLTRPARPCTLLIVDGDDYGRSVLRTSLQSDNLVVHEASKGREGLTIAEHIRPEVILLEYRLPDGIDSLHFLHRLRASSWGCQTAVAVFTADFGAFEMANEVTSLDATIACKLCSLEQISHFVACLSSQAPVPSLPGELTALNSPDRVSEGGECASSFTPASRWRNRWVVYSPTAQQVSGQRSFEMKAESD
jgi:AraC-like DNA-binding protein/CheY-like chemotaxis protein